MEESTAEERLRHKRQEAPRRVPLPPLPPGGRRYDSDRLVVVPAHDGTIPAISVDEAIARVARGGSRGRGLGLPEAELMVADGGVIVDEAHPATTGGYALTSRLVWVLTWRDVPGAIRGPRGSYEELRRRMVFTDTVIVDATTGEMLYDGQHGEKRPR